MKLFSHARAIALICIVAAGIGLVLWIRGGSGEDTWLCVEGQWIRHGNPEAPEPRTPCRTTEPPDAQASARQVNPADQPMKRLATAEFSMQYPDWPQMDPKSIREPKRTMIAVRAAGCALVVTNNALPSNQDFESTLEQMLSEQIAQTDARVLSRNIGASTSHVEAEFPIAGRILKTDQYGYLSSARMFYSVVFAAERSVFASSCAPVIAAVIASVTVQ